MLDYNARYYDTGLGRFISPDTVIPDPTNPQNLNRYSYVLGNPVNHTDPTGHQCIGALCLPPPQPIPWREITRIAGPLVVAAPEAAAITGVAVIGLGGSYVGATWAMQDMGPSNPANPWTGGWTETLPLGEGGLSSTSPLPGTNTLGTEGPTILTTPLEDEPVTFGLEFPLKRPSVLGDNVVDSTIYRGGGTNPGNLTPRPQDNGELSFRGSLSNPWPLPEGQRPPLPAGQPYFGVDTTKLPPGSVIYDNIPPGHVSVKDVPVEVIKDAIIEKGKFPK